MVTNLVLSLLQLAARFMFDYSTAQSTTHFSDMAHCYILVRVDIPEGKDPLTVVQDCELSVSIDDEDDNTLFLNTEIEHVYDQNNNLLF